ncbi:MAG TPA: glycoside hydrolase family 44 protein [Steroidobacteraceae bacterium]|nr:glycoside hydrolase family 44 protein [Steroidobacteraceae bacterium]
MRVVGFSRGAMLAALGLLGGCGGGGGGGSPAPAPSPPPPPAQKTLFVATQPVGAAQATVFATQPVVHVRTNGATDTTDNTTVVTAALVAGTGTAGAQLTGTTTATAVAGIATFTNLGISLAGTNYQLRFTAGGTTEATSAAFGIAAPPPPTVTFSIDSAQDVHPISRFIYGMNGWDPAAARPKNLTLSRSGGNRMTAYNWETNDSNAGADFQNQNDTFLGGGNEPNGAVRPGLEAARAAGAGMIVTLPIIGYVSADHLGNGDVGNTPNYLSVRFHQSLPRKGGAFSTAPDTTDAFVYQDEYVHFLDDKYPGAFAAANNPIWLSLDNEPDLWQSTHARLRGDTNPATQSGQTATYAEMIQRTTDYADAAKDVNPAALILGPVNYGWQGMIRFQDASDANGRDFLEFYLAQMKAAENATGHRLVDVLDVHWYPEARGACVRNPMDGCRITDEDTDAGAVAARKQAPRSLWDPTYTENSWIAQFSTQGPIRLLPRLQDKIAANYPGTKLSITEYNYGAANHISGAIAQADVLGIFGREGLFAATLWRLATNNDFIYGGFDMFRNFDGANGSFGDTSIRATTSDLANATVYASVDNGNANRMVIVCINKSDADTTASLAITHGVQFHTAKVYQLTSASPQGRPQAGSDIAITQANDLQLTMPANSVTTLLLLP